ncbi:MAG: sugar ABC transporter substrate-binding protein [Ilumatobacteraceae bacterium]
MINPDEMPPVGRRRFLQGIVAIGGLAAGGGLLAACGSDKKTASTTAPTTAGSTATTTAGSTAGTDAAATTVAGTDAGATTVAGTTGASLTPGPTSGVIGVTLNGVNDYAKQLATGVYEAFKGTPYTIEVASDNYDAGTELTNAEALISKGAVGIVGLAVTAESAASAAQAAQAAKIPYANSLWPGASDADKYFTAVAALDSVKGGTLIGEYLKTTLPAGGKICVVQGIVGQGFSELIDQGLDASLAGSAFKVVAREQGFFDRTKAVGVVETAFQANPDLAVIVAYAASMSDGIAQWLKDNNKATILHVSSDADEEMIGWIKTPYLKATRYYSAAQTGLIAGQGLLKALKGETPAFKTEVDQIIATAENIDDVVAKNPYVYAEFKDKVANL